MKKLSFIVLYAIPLLIPGAQEGDASKSLVEMINKLIDKPNMTKEESHLLYRQLNRLEENMHDAWKTTSALDIDKTAAGKAWKQGQKTHINFIKKESTKAAGGTVGWMSSGKDFLDPDFHPITSDYDLTVTGKNADSAIEAMNDVAPGDYIKKRNMSVMDSKGNFHRFRGSPDMNLTAEQLKFLRDKEIAQMKEMAKKGGGYVSPGALTGLEGKYAAGGKYAENMVEFLDVDGNWIGEVAMSDLKGDLQTAFGKTNNSAGDLLGMAADNMAQMKNYLRDKGNAKGMLKTLERQKEVFEKLPENLKKEFGHSFDDMALMAKRLDGATDDVLNEGMRKFLKMNEDLIVLTGKAIDPKIISSGTAGAYQLEKNLLGSAMNVGGMDELMRIIGNDGNLAHLKNAAGEIVETYGDDTIKGLVKTRAAALNGVADVLKQKRMLMEALEKTDASLARKIATYLDDLPLPALLELTVTGTFAAYDASSGNYRDALTSLSEGLTTMAIPALGAPLLLKDVGMLSMAITYNMFIDSYSNERVKKAIRDITKNVFGSDFNDYDKTLAFIRKNGLDDPEKLRKFVENEWDNSAGFVEIHGLVPALKQRLVEQLTASIKQVKEIEKKAKEMKDRLSIEAIMKESRLKKLRESMGKQRQQKLNLGNLVKLRGVSCDFAGSHTVSRNGKESLYNEESGLFQVYLSKDDSKITWSGDTVTILKEHSENSDSFSTSSMSSITLKFSNDGKKIISGTYKSSFSTSQDDVVGKKSFGIATAGGNIEVSFSNIPTSNDEGRYHYVVSGAETQQHVSVATNKSGSKSHWGTTNFSYLSTNWNGGTEDGARQAKIEIVIYTE